ncbi:MAG: DUF262 domain-containing protein [Prolixibacteraceae bacterium]
MEHRTLTSLLDCKIFQIPDFQKEFCWGENQLKALLKDVDEAIQYSIVHHYCGTIVLYQPKDCPTMNYGLKKMEMVKIIDGQQRLIAISLFLSIVLNKLIIQGQSGFISEIPHYLFRGTDSKLVLNEEIYQLYFDLISKGTTTMESLTKQQQRLLFAHRYIQKQLNLQLDQKGKHKLEYLMELFDALISKIVFSVYTIRIDAEVYRTYENINRKVG